jgi:acetoin utilization deacetylase AcuC-like enzyme
LGPRCRHGGGRPSSTRRPRGARTLRRLHVWTHDRWSFPLPEAHKFPLSKYALLRERIAELGLCAHDEIHESEPVSWEALGRVHEAALLQRIRTGALTLRESRALGLPWSPELVERGRRSTHGTLHAAREALRVGVAMNIGGGTHHAGRDFARGYCLFNDVALALDVLRGGEAVRRAVVVDCDVHQGDGTAHLLGPDPDAFTLSLHGARNYPFQRIPSDLDVDLPSGTGDAGYLAALVPALERALDGGPYDIAFYLAGADPWEGDRLGRLALTKDGLRRRDALVLDTLADAGLPVCVVLAGGYAPDVRDTVDINAATATEVAARAG